MYFSEKHPQGTVEFPIASIIDKHCQDSLELPEDCVDDLLLPPCLCVVLEICEIVIDLIQHALSVTIRIDEWQIRHKTSIKTASYIIPSQKTRIFK